MQSCYISYQCTQWKSRTCSLTLRPPRSMFTMWKHGRVDGTVAQHRRVGEKMSGPRLRAPTPPSLEKIQNTTYALCVSRWYIFHFFLCVFSVCLKLSLSTHTTVSSNILTRVLSFDLCWTLGPITCWPENAPKNIYIEKRKKKTAY